MAVTLIPVLMRFGRHLPPLCVVIEVNKNVKRLFLWQLHTTHDATSNRLYITIGHLLGACNSK